MFTFMVERKKLVGMALLGVALVGLMTSMAPNEAKAANLDYRWYGRFHRIQDARGFADHVLTLPGAQIASVSSPDSRGVYYVLVAWRPGSAKPTVTWNGHQVHSVTNDPRQ